MPSAVHVGAVTWEWPSGAVLDQVRPGRTEGRRARGGLQGSLAACGSGTGEDWWGERQEAREQGQEGSDLVSDTEGTRLRG